MHRDDTIEGDDFEYLYSGYRAPGDKESRGILTASQFFQLVIVLIAIGLLAHFIKKRQQADLKAEEERLRKVEIDDITATVQELDIETQLKDGMKFNGPICYSGDIKVQNPPIDDQFGVIGSNYAFMQRKVEVFCWKEIITTRMERRVKFSKKVTDYKYEVTWVDSRCYIDSKNFRDKTYNYNKRPQFNSQKIASKEPVVVGPIFQVDPNQFLHTECQSERLLALFPNGGMASKVVELPDNNGDWSYE